MKGRDRVELPLSSCVYGWDVRATSAAGPTSLRQQQQREVHGLLAGAYESAADISNSAKRMGGMRRGPSRRGIERIVLRCTRVESEGLNG